MKNKDKIITVALSLFLFLVALIYHLTGILHSHPFWEDEFSSAHQAYYILEYGFSLFSHKEIYFEYLKFIPSLLVAISFKLFGHSESIARLPFAVIGAGIPPMLFLLLRKKTNTITALTAAILTISSYFVNTWAVQARGYIVVVFLTIVTFYLYFQILEKKKCSVEVILLIVTAAIGCFTHPFYFITLLALVTHLLLYKFPLSARIKYIGLVICFVIGTLVLNLYFKNNNLWYYHSLLWREYGLISLLGIFGLGIGFVKKPFLFSLFWIYALLQFIFINYGYGPYTSRYALPIFPYLFVGMAYLFSYIADAVVIDTKYSSKLRYIIPLLLIGFIILNGYKFVIKPKQFYSVNHDFRDIALVDYNQVYSIIKDKGNLSANQTAVIDTWPDRLNWYLGDNFQPAYTFRWGTFSGTTNGLSKNTPYILNSKGEKTLTRRNGMRLITSLSDLKRAMKEYPHGFIYINDTSMPHDVIEYAEKNFKKELYLDHYPLDDNPYSIWPATLYSWGVK